MKNIHKNLFLLVSFFIWLTVTVVMAETALQNSKDMPGEKSIQTLSNDRKKVCFADMCLGQDIQSVSVKWKSLVFNRSGRMETMQLANAKLFLSKYVLGLTSPEIEFLAPYFVHDIENVRFDDKVLEFFKNRKPVFCHAAGLRGEFVSPSGHTTHVDIAYDLDQTWRVTTIRRFYKGLSQLEQASIIEKLEKAYPQLIKRSVGILQIYPGLTPGDFEVEFQHPVWVNGVSTYNLQWGEGFVSLLEDQLKIRKPGSHGGIEAVFSQQEKCTKDTPLD